VRRALRILIVLLAVAVAATGALALRKRFRTDDLPRLAQVPAFRLQERGGGEVTLEDLRGQRWVADFIFTQCGGICPAMTARLARLRREVPADVRFVSITVDPRHDTREVLADYAKRAGADARWLFLTGPQKDLYRLSTEGFKLAAFEVSAQDQAAGADGPFLHSSKFVLVDREATIRGYYDSDDETEVAELIRDLECLPGPTR
jgi:cytochrome oxidase Cu insertion factor (SCO1/SenC/PrrC family)